MKTSYRRALSLCSEAVARIIPHCAADNRDFDSDGGPALADEILVDCGLKGLPAPAALRHALVSLGLPVSASIIVLASALGSVALFAINSGDVLKV